MNDPLWCPIHVMSHKCSYNQKIWNRPAVPPLAAEIDRLRAEVAVLKAALGEAQKGLAFVVRYMASAPNTCAERANAALARIRPLREKSAELPRENVALLGEANQAINTMLELWAAHTSSPPASRADEIERALNRVRRAAAGVGRALKERSDG